MYLRDVKKYTNSDSYNPFGVCLNFRRKYNTLYELVIPTLSSCLFNYSTLLNVTFLQTRIIFKHREIPFLICLV